jgi:hypothetical protein
VRSLRRLARSLLFQSLVGAFERPRCLKEVESVNSPEAAERRLLSVDEPTSSPGLQQDASVTFDL